MRKLLLFFIPIAIALTANAQNLVTNGGFEEWTSNTVPTGWTIADGMEKEATTVKEGSFSAKQTSAGSAVKLQQFVPVQGGTTYTITYWFLDNDVNAKCRMWSAWMAGTSALTDNAIVFQPTTYSDNNSEWQQVTYTLEAPETATQLRFEIRTYKEVESGGFIYFDGFSVVPQGAATNVTDIFSFTVEGQQGETTIDNQAGTINFNMVKGSDVAALSPVITVATGASVSPLSGVAQNFTNPVTYTVTAADGTTTKQFTASVTFVDETIVLLNQDFETVVNNETVALEGWNNIAEVGTKLWIGKLYNNNLYAQMSSYNSAEANKTWLVTPVINLDQTENETLSFDMAIGYFTHNGFSVLVSQNFDGTNLATATWDDITNKFTIPEGNATGYTLMATAGIADISSYNGNIYVAFKYTGDATASQTTTYQVDNVLVKGTKPSEPSTATDILSFTFPNQVGQAVIDTANHTVTAELLAGEALTAIVPVIAVSDGADISPESGVAQNFTTAVEYTVTAEDATTTQVWTVTITNAIIPSTEANVLTFSFENEVEPSVINLTDTTITALMPWNIEIDSLIPAITVSSGAQVTPTVAQDFTKVVTYTVTAQDGITKKYWKVSVSQTERPSNEAEILSFVLAAQTADAVIDSANRKVTCEVVYGTNITALTPTIRVSEGAKYTPEGAVDFTNPVVYTVVAADTTVKVEWTVTVNVAPRIVTKVYDIQYTTDASGDSPYKDKTVTTKGVVTGVKSNGIFIQDGNGAYNGLWVYVGKDPGAVLKDSVYVTGKIIEYYGLTEMEKATVEVINSNNTLPTPAVVSIADFKEGYEGVLVTIANVVCSDTNSLAKYGSWYSYSSTNDTILIDDDMFLLPALPGQVFSSITGIGTYSYNYFRLLPRDQNDVLVSFNQQQATQISVYPNPVNGVLYVNNLVNAKTIVLSNVLGQSVIVKDVKSSVEQFNTDVLNNGIYIVTVINNDGTRQSKRIVKN